MNDYLQRHPNMPEIKNPVLQTENFNRHWDQRRYPNFRNRVQSYAATAKRAKSEPSAENAIKVWQELFGDSFGKGGSSGSGGTSGIGSSARPGQSSSRGARPAAAGAASIPVAPRPNEARRFG